MVRPLVDIILQTEPDLVTVSGDFTQRARAHQFAEARQFLDSLPFPQLHVPGNHDIPLHNVFARFGRPLKNYKEYITKDLQPVFFDNEMVVVGINTARSLTRKYGRINAEQLAMLRQRLAPFDDKVTKILVTHHPFDLPEGYGDQRQLVGRAAMAMDVISDSGVDLLLAGHLHLAHIGFTSKRYRVTGHSALAIQAGTAISTRGRGEQNSFNVLRVEPARIVLERKLWEPERGYIASPPATFVRREGEWHAEAKEEKLQ